MKTFRGHVSKAQEGILSENPEARMFDSTPTLGEVGDRARANTLAWVLRKEDMGDMGDRQDAGEKGNAPGAMDLEISSSHTSSEERALGPFADRPGIPDMASSPTGNMVNVRLRGRRLFSTRSLLIALDFGTGVAGNVASLVRNRDVDPSSLLFPLLVNEF